MGATFEPGDRVSRDGVRMGEAPGSLVPVIQPGTVRGWDVARGDAYLVAFDHGEERWCRPDDLRLLD